MYESMCTDSRISENFPIIYNTHGWVICGQCFMDECIVDRILVVSVSWMVSHEYVCEYIMDECIVESINIAEEKQVTHNTKYLKTG